MLEQLIAKNNRSNFDVVIPRHLSDATWIDFEFEAALKLSRNLSVELNKLNQKVSERRVHKARVALRRWFTIWKVLKEDGWQTKSLRAKIVRPLKDLLSLLGKLRDFDVSISICQELEAPKKLLDDLQKSRNKLRVLISDYIHSSDIDKLSKRLEKQLKKRAKKYTKSSFATKKAKLSAFKHIDKYVVQQEKTVRKLAKKAMTPKQLHQLRLGIKGWRYLLAEFFGLTTLELVTTQQLLGQIHDLDRVAILLSKSKNSENSLRLLAVKRSDLLKDFEQVRENMPYGLRPAVISMKTNI